MSFTRKIIAEFVAVFLVGALAGGLITWSYTDTQLTSFMNKTADKPDSMVARMNKKYADDYHLSPDELQRIQPIFHEMAQNIYQVRHQFGSDMITVLDKYHQQIAEQLTPEHRAAYETAVTARKKKLTNILLLDQSSPAEASK